MEVTIEHAKLFNVFIDVREEVLARVIDSRTLNDIGQTRPRAATTGCRIIRPLTYYVGSIAWLWAILIMIGFFVLCVRLHGRLWSLDCIGQFGEQDDVFDYWDPRGVGLADHQPGYPAASK